MAPLMRRKRPEWRQKQSLDKRPGLRRRLPSSFLRPGGQTKGRPFNTFFADDITADRSETAARIFNQGADTYRAPTSVGSMVSTKFTVAVINHADDIRFDGFLQNGSARQCALRKASAVSDSLWNAGSSPAFVRSLIAFRILS